MKYIFDVDGTLTPARKQMKLDFMAYFLKFECKHDVYLVTGSDRQKTVEQLGLDIYNRAKRVYNCSGSDVYEQDRNVYRDDWTPSDKVRQFLQDELDFSQFTIRTGTHIEERPGCINFSILGRGANWSEREVYKAWDKDEHESQEIARRFNDRFPDLFATVGGETGLDIAPHGRDKSQILRDFDRDVKFFGDKMDPGGNDHLLASKIREKKIGATYYVFDYKHTWDLLKYETSERESKG